MQNWNDLIRTQLDNLASFPPKQTWMLGEWIGECAVRPEVANFAALPLIGNELGDVRVSLADQAWYIWDGAAWQSMGGGGGGAVNSVTASAPLASSGGANPDISLTGIVAPANGGTGIALPGALNNVLTSNGAGAWTSSAPASTSPAAPLTSVQFNNAGAFGGSAGLTWNGSTLAVDGAVDRATAGTLTVGGATATAITIGDVGVTTTFPGPVELVGDVTTVGGTTFSTDATFDGDVTFGNASTDNISFVGQIDTAITQEGIAAPAVSPASTGRIYFDSGTNTFKASQNGGAYVDVINSAAPGGAVGDVQLNDGVGNFAGSTDLTFASNTLTVTNTVDVTNGANTLTVQAASIGSDAATLTVDAGTTVQVGGVALVNISGAFTLPGVGGANGQVLTTDGAGTAAWQTPSGGATAQGGANAIQYANTATPANFDGNANFVYVEATGRLGVGTATPNEAATINGVLSIAEGASPSNTAAFGKLWANSAADARPYWLDDTGQVFNLTLDRFNTLTPAASVAIDTSPALPIFNSLALNQNTTFTTNNLGNGRSASVRVVGDASTRTLTFPVGWTWLGSGTPSSLAAGDVGYLSITAYGAADTDVVAAWSYENAPAVVIGGGVATQIAYFSTSSTISSETAVGSNSFTWDATNNRLGVGTATPTTAIDLASGQLAIPDGTAVAPAIAFRDDLNNGIFSPATDIFGIAVNGTEVARFQQSGAGNTPVMLMGTSTVYGAITVDSSEPSGAVGVVMLGHAAAGTTLQESYRGGQLAGVRSRGTKAAPTAVGAGDGLVNVLGAGWTATGGINYGGLVTVKAEQSYTATASGGRVEIHTTLNGTDGVTTLGGTSTERMRIANDGRVAIGQSGGSIIPAAAGSILTLAGGLTQSAGAVSLTGNAASSFTTSAGDLTLTGGVNLQLAAGFGSAVIVNEFASNVDFRVESQANANMLLVDASQSSVSVGTTGNTHTFNIGTGAASNFAVASGGRIHTYDGAAPLDGQVLIGDTALGNFAKAALTAGTGISVTNGAGSVTIAATGTTASAFVDIPGYVAQQALNAGDLVRFVDDAGTPKVQKADATDTDVRLNPVGFAVAAALVGGAVTVRVAGVADVPAARFDVAPGVANVGQRVFVSTTAGQITLTAPSASGDVLQRAGVLVDGGANPKVLVQVGDPTLL